VTVRGAVILLIMRYGQAKTQPTEPSQSNGALVVKYSNSAVMQQPNAKNAGEFGVAVTSHADQERRAQQHGRHQELIRDPLFLSCKLRDRPVAPSPSPACSRSFFQVGAEGTGPSTSLIYTCGIFPPFVGSSPGLQQHVCVGVA
jgi:hypothetical protein